MYVGLGAVVLGLGMNAVNWSLCRPLLSERKMYKYTSLAIQTDADMALTICLIWSTVPPLFTLYWSEEKSCRDLKWLLRCTCTAPNYAHLILLEESCLLILKYSKICFEMYRWKCWKSQLKSRQKISSIFLNVHYKVFLPYVVWIGLLKSIYLILINVLRSQSQLVATLKLFRI